MDLSDQAEEAVPLELTATEIERFKEDGYLCIRQAFSPEKAFNCRNAIWNAMMQDGISPMDPMTWPRRKSIGHVYSAADGVPWSDVISKRLIKGIDTICGEDRWCKPLGLGWWTVGFPGYFADSPWDVDGQWHVDGSNVHYPFNKEIGLTAIMLFSDVHDNIHGATTALKGSHKYISGVIAEAGFRGLSGYQIKKVLNECEGDWEAEQLCGLAGDVFLMHPLLVHARSRNVGQFGDISAVRFVCHPTIPLKEHMNFCGKDLTPLEQSIFDSVPLTDGYNPLYFITPSNVAEFAENRKKREDESGEQVGRKRKQGRVGHSGDGEGGEEEHPPHGEDSIRSYIS